MRSALIVFAKRPTAGTVKTRLTTLLTPEEAAYLYEAFLKDALLQYTTLEVDVRLYFGPPEGPVAEGLIPEGVSRHLQQGPGLGARMKVAFVESFAAGYERLVVIGTDHPTLPSAYITQAFQALTEPGSICIGPSEDGGFYLLGMNNFYPELFHDMRYSHEEVFTQTLQRGGNTGAQLSILPPWYDVDTPESLLQLIDDLSDPKIGASQTRAVVKGLQSKYASLND